MKKQDIFITELNNTKDISKADIIMFGEEYGIISKQSEAKAKIIKRIVDRGFYENLFTTFQEFIYIPSWVVGDYFKMNSQKIDDLYRIRVIKEIPKSKEFYNRSARGYYQTNTYPLSVLEYDIELLQEAYNQAFKKDWFKIRLETETEDEVHQVINQLKKIFVLRNGVDIYEKRNQGFNSYLQVSLLNNTEYEGNKFLSDIENLKKEIKKIKVDEAKERNDVEQRYLNIFGVKNFFELQEMKEEYDSMKKYCAIKIE